MILIMMELSFLCEKNILARRKEQYLHQCVLLWKQTDYSNTYFRSKFWKLDRFVACNWWKQVTFSAYQRFWRINVCKRKNKQKNFCKSCSQCFSSRKILTEHKDVCLSINGAQSLRLEKGTTEFKNYFKKIPVLFKIYADFNCNL